MALPELGDAIPQRGNRCSRWFWRAVFRMAGWDVEGQIPNLSKFVIIGAPHTSNWDFPVAMAFVLAVGLDAHWIGKHTLFRWPFGGFMRWLGGTPVVRSEQRGVVDQVVEQFEDHERMVFGLSPEGTRKRVERWKTGFYHIALGAGVPILPGYFDYPRKMIGFGAPLMPTGDLEADIETLKAFYAPFRGKKPDQF